MFDAVMNFNLGEEIDALRETVRRFAAEEIAPRAAEIDKLNSFPEDLWEKMGALGLHGITVAEADGGAGWQRHDAAGIGSRSRRERIRSQHAAALR